MVKFGTFLSTLITINVYNNGYVFVSANRWVFVASQKEAAKLVDSQDSEMYWRQCSVILLKRNLYLYWCFSFFFYYDCLTSVRWYFLRFLTSNCIRNFCTCTTILLAHRKLILNVWTDDRIHIIWVQDACGGVWS